MYCIGLIRAQKTVLASHVAGHSHSLSVFLSRSITHPFGLKDSPLLLPVLLLAFIRHCDLVRHTCHAKWISSLSLIVSATQRVLWEALSSLHVIGLKLDFHPAALREVRSHPILSASKECVLHCHLCRWLLWHYLILVLHLGSGCTNTVLGERP